MVTAAMAAGFLAFMLLLSSSLNPLYLAFGQNWQPVGAALGVAGLAVICLIGTRYTARHES